MRRGRKGQFVHNGPFCDAARQRGQSGRPREWGVVNGSVADSSLPRRPTAEGPAANQPLRQVRLRVHRCDAAMTLTPHCNPQ